MHRLNIHIWDMRNWESGNFRPGRPCYGVSGWADVFVGSRVAE